MSPTRGTRHFAASLVAIAVMTAFAPSASATGSGSGTDCNRGRKALPTLTAEIARERRQYRSTDFARVDVFVTRQINGFEMPAPNVEVSVLLSQGSTRHGGSSVTDESGAVTIRVPLAWFGRGHLDVRAYAWSRITPEGWQCPEVGEAGEDLALDLFRIVGK